MNRDEALQFANDRPMSGGDDLYQWAVDAENLIRRLCATPVNTPPAAWVPHADCDSPELCAISKSCAGQFGTRSLCYSCGEEKTQHNGTRCVNGKENSYFTPAPQVPVTDDMVLAAERDEADRRAGAAERELASVRSDLDTMRRVREKMKEQWGAHPNTSFDVVWDEALTLKAGAMLQTNMVNDRNIRGDGC